MHKLSQATYKTWTSFLIILAIGARHRCNGIRWSHASWNNVSDCHPTLTRQLKPLQSSTGHGNTCVEGQDDLEKRILGGVRSDEGQWPWLVAVGRKSRGPQCGGSLVAPSWVLTAAHCFRSKENPCDFNVRLGEHHMFEDNEHHVDITVQKILVHPNYHTGRGGVELNDIAMVKLSQSVSLEDHDVIHPICLPSDTDKFPVGTNCTVAGWGRIDLDSAAGSAVVRHLSVPIVTPSVCRRAYGLIHRGTFCAGYTTGGKDSCQGDSGGPLVCPTEDGRRVQLGLVSWGEGCGTRGKPGVYTNVHYYKQWINGVITNY